MPRCRALRSAAALPSPSGAGGTQNLLVRLDVDGTLAACISLYTAQEKKRKGDGSWPYCATRVLLEAMQRHLQERARCGEYTCDEVLLHAELLAVEQELVAEVGPQRAALIGLRNAIIRCGNTLLLAHWRPDCLSSEQVAPSSMPCTHARAARAACCPCRPTCCCCSNLEYVSPFKSLDDGRRIDTPVTVPTVQACGGQLLLQSLPCELDKGLVKLACRGHDVQCTFGSDARAHVCSAGFCLSGHNFAATMLLPGVRGLFSTLEALKQDCAARGRV